MLRYGFPLIYCILAASTVAAAQDRLTLERAVTEALGESPVVAQADARQREAKWEKVASYSHLLPNVALFATHSFDTQYETLPFSAGPINAEVPIAFPKTAFGAEMNWTLFDGFANWNLNSAAIKEQSAAQAMKARKQFEIRKLVELQFNAVLAAIEMSAVAVHNLKTIEDSLSMAESRVRNGAATAPDVLRVEVQRTEAQAEVQRTSDAIAIQRQKLRQVMGLANDDRELDGQLAAPGAKQKVSALSFAGIEGRDDIRALQLQSEASADRKAASYGELLPKVSVVGRVENYDNTDYALTGSTGSFRAAYDIGLTLKWDIFDSATIAKPGIANARRDLAESQHREAVLNAPTDFEMWKRRYLYSTDLYEARVRDIKRAEESLRIITLSFQQGRRIVNEVLDAEADLFRARAGAVQSRFEAAEALNQLELAIGKDLI